MAVRSSGRRSVERADDGGRDADSDAVDQAADQRARRRPAEDESDDEPDGDVPDRQQPAGDGRGPRPVPLGPADGLTDDRMRPVTPVLVFRPARRSAIPTATTGMVTASPAAAGRRRHRRTPPRRTMPGSTTTPTTVDRASNQCLRRYVAASTTQFGREFDSASSEDSCSKLPSKILKTVSNSEVYNFKPLSMPERGHFISYNGP